MNTASKETCNTEFVGARVPPFLPPLYDTFFTAMLCGRSFQPQPHDIDRAIDHYFSYDPLTTLSSQQEALLKADMRELYAYIMFSKNTWRALAGDTFLVGPNDQSHPMFDSLINIPDEYILFAGKKATSLGRQFHIIPLTPTEKEELLSDPAIYARVNIQIDHTSGGVLSNGTRHLANEQDSHIKFGRHTLYESYGYTIREFTDQLTQVRTAQKKSQTDTLLGLDIGGSNGLGAHDAEQLDPNLNVTNITIDPELAFWPLRGGHRFLYAERLPKNFSEQFDIVFSNLAFRYMRYRDIALENAIRALRIGGILHVFFSSDYKKRSGQTRQQIDEAIDAQFQRMEQLQRRGIIKYLPAKRGFTNARKEWKMNPTYDVHGMVCLQKTGHIL